MKIQIIQLDEHDDIISVKDKMSWCKTARIILVWPKGRKVLTGQLDLVLLLRKSVSLGSQLGLVTRHKEVKANAEELGIPVFVSVARAQRSYWKHSRSKLPVQVLKPPNDFRMTYLQVKPIRPGEFPTSFVRISIFIFGVLAVLSLLLAFIPGAKVNIIPNTNLQQLEFQVYASELIQAPDLFGSLPLRKISLEIEKKDSLPTTGQAAVPVSFAAGYVEFTNLTDQAFDIPEGTKVSGGTFNNNIFFVTTRSGYIAAGPGKTVNIPVKALKPGESGNLRAGSIDTIDDALGLSLSATNTVAMTGGSSVLGSAASQNDLLVLQRKLQETIFEAAKNQAMSHLQPGDQIISQTLTQISILGESQFPEVGQPGDILTLSLHVAFSMNYISGKDLYTLASSVLNANKPTGYLPVNDDIQLFWVGEPTIDANQVVQWKYIAKRKLQDGIDAQKVMAMIPGLSISEATQRLAARLNLAQKPTIMLSPWWWPRLPLFSMRIDVITGGAN